MTTTDTVLDKDAQRELAAQMVERARVAGIDLVGPGGLLTGLTKQVLEAALEEELSEPWAMTSTTRSSSRSDNAGWRASTRSRGR